MTCASSPSSGRITLRLLVLFLVTAALAPSQDFRARLTVTVADASGSLVPGAAAELRSASTGAALNGETNESGIYTFLYLQPGAYTLTVSKPGFKPVQRDNIILQTFQAAGLNIALEVGAVTDAVVVTAEAALLQTESASRGIVVNSKLVEDLPMPQNNPMMLGQTMPGVFMRPLGIFYQPWAITSQYAINGGLEGVNDFQVDGAPNNAQLGTNTFGYVPPSEATQEVSVQANSYDAQYGRTSGGAINMTTKSGTNTFHGSAWTYLQRVGWNANSFQNNAAGQGRTPHKQDQWGLMVSGPLIVPKVLPKDGRFRMFYMFSWDQYSQILPNARTISVPGPEMRNGDFSKLTTADGRLIRIFDPASGRTDANGNFVRDAFVGNIIPANRINPLSKAVVALFPQPNITNAGVRYSQQNFDMSSNVFDWSFFNWLAKMDFHFGDKHRVFVRPARMLFEESTTYNGIQGPGNEGGFFSRTNYALVADYVGTLTPTLIVNIRANATQFGAGWAVPDNRNFDWTKLGLAPDVARQLGDNLFGRIEFQNYAGLGRAQDWNTTNTYSLQGSVTKMAGAHALRIGTDNRLTHYTVYNSGFPLYYGSNSDWTRETWNQPASEVTSGDSLATFLLGNISNGRFEYRVRPFFRSWYIAPWIQDDWKVNSRLTINLGLRWDLNTPPDEKYNRLNVGFDTSVKSPVSQLIPADRIAANPRLGNLTGAIRFAGVNGERAGAMRSDWNNIQPRIGVAYKINNRIVVRGGYGKYYTNFQSNSMLQTLGFSGDTAITTSLDSRTPIPNIVTSPFTGAVPQPAGASAGDLTFVGRGITQYNSDYTIPEVHQFSAGLQFLLTGSSVLDVSYVGNRIVGWGMTRNNNLPSWDFAKQCDTREGGNRALCDTLGPNPFQGVEVFRGLRYFTAAQISLYDLNRPYAQFDGTVNIDGLNRQKFWYDSLQVNFNQRLRRGLVFNANYVWSKQMQEGPWTDEIRGTLQRGPYGIMRPHVFKVSASYDVPFGRGRTFGGSMNRWLDGIAGGWQVAPSLFIQSGEPADYPANAQPLRNPKVSEVNWNQHQVRGWGACVLNADDRGNITPLEYSVRRYGCSATDFSQYDWIVYRTLPGQRLTPQKWGNLYMKPYLDSNLAIMKTFRIREKINLRFRAQATNLFNHFNYLRGRFNTNPFDENFGTSFPALTDRLDAPPRNLQFGLRLNW